MLVMLWIRFDGSLLGMTIGTGREVQYHGRRIVSYCTTAQHFRAYIDEDWKGWHDTTCVICSMSCMYDIE
jgi:hypothetical protein